MTIPVTEAELNALQGLVGERYQPLALLGKKSGRKTLLAQELETNAKVVIKLLTFGEDFSWDDLKLFEREAETLRSLEHSAIPQYLDYFEVETPRSKGFALVQSYIEARSLAEQIKAGRRFSEEALEEIAQQLLEILEYLHSRQPAVIHRDIKPSNILLTDRTAHSVGQVYLVDFGSVQTLAAREGGTVTVVGTYGYMPPEQFGGRAVPASDLYSLGATLIYLASGKHPADLPQDELRLEFEEFVQLSPTRMDWLRTLVEPGLKRRFGSAKEAIATRQAVTRAERLSISEPVEGLGPIQTKCVFPEPLSHPQLGSACEFSQSPEALSFQFPASSLKITSLKAKSEEAGCVRVFFVALAGFVGLITLAMIYNIIVGIVGSLLAPPVLVAVLVIILRLSQSARANSKTMIVINAKEIRVQRPYKADRVFARHHAWQIQRKSAGQFCLRVGGEQFLFSLLPDDARWLSRTLSLVLQLPEELPVQKDWVGDRP